VFENLDLALAATSLYAHLVRSLGRQAQKRREIYEVLEIIGLAPQHQAMGGTIAQGQKQWLEIGMLLMQEPELLLVDEPVAGMNPQEIERTAKSSTVARWRTLGGRGGARHWILCVHRPARHLC